MASRVETLKFIDECKYALEHLFQALELQLKVFKDLDEKLESITQKEALLTEIFVEQDQWSPAANFYYMQNFNRMKSLVQSKQEIFESQNKARETLAHLGATEESMAVLASAVIQLGKQVLSFRFGKNKPKLKNAREVASQSIVELIWEGRNHTMHWEESNPRPPVRKMFQKLERFGIKIVQGHNNALLIMDVLGWNNASQVIKDLKSLVATEMEEN